MTEPKLDDPGSEQTKNVIRDLKTNYFKVYHCEMTDVQLVKEVVEFLKIGDMVPEIRAIMQCLFQHFVSWNLLNAQIYPRGDCILTVIAASAPHLVIPFLELHPPEEYDRPNAETLGEDGLPAVSWIMDNPEWTSATATAFNYLVERTSDNVLRLCFTHVKHRRTSLLHAILITWDFVIRSNSDKAREVRRRAFESIQLLLTRSDDDCGGGVDLRVVDHCGRFGTALSLMEKLTLTLTSVDDDWKQIQTNLESATKRALEYGSKLLSSLSAALGNSLAKIQPLHALVASYSPALYPPTTLTKTY